MMSSILEIYKTMLYTTTPLYFELMRAGRFDLLVKTTHIEETMSFLQVAMRDDLDD